jgi:DNA replication protein
MLKEQGFKHIQPPDYWRHLRIVDIPEDACPTCGGLGTLYDLSVDPAKAAAGIYELTPCPTCQPTSCATCGGTGEVRTNAPYGHPEFGKLVECPAPDCPVNAEKRERRRQAAIAYSKLPDGYEDCTFATFDAKPQALLAGKMLARWAAHYFVAAIVAGERGYVNARLLAEQFNQAEADDLRNWLVFHGEPGRGKTGMAAAIFHALHEVGHFALWISLGDYFEAVQTRYKKKQEEPVKDVFGDMSADEVVHEVRSAPLLLIDEFDVPGATPDRELLMQKLICHRHDYNLPTIVTTNLDDRQLKAKWSPMIASRMKAKAHWIPVTGPTLRRDTDRDVRKFAGWE